MLMLKRYIVQVVQNRVHRKLIDDNTIIFSCSSHLTVCGSLVASVVSSYVKDLVAFPLSLFVTLVIKAVCRPANRINGKKIAHR